MIRFIVKDTSEDQSKHRHMERGLGGSQTQSAHVLRTHHPSGTSTYITNQGTSRELPCPLFLLVVRSLD